MRRRSALAGGQNCSHAPSSSTERAGCPRRSHGAVTAAQQGARQARPVRDMDLVLHLPMRYEDETRVVHDPRGCAAATGAGRRRGHRKRSIHSARAASCWCTIADETRRAAAALHEFLPSQQKQLAEGTRVRARGERARLLRRRDGPPGVQGHQRGRAAADRTDARVSVRRRLVAGVPARAIADALARVD